jgi:hypothetical protein
MRNQLGHDPNFLDVKTVDCIVSVAGNSLKALLKFQTQTAKSLGQQAIETLVCSLLSTTIHNHVTHFILKTVKLTKL